MSEVNESLSPPDDYIEETHRKRYHIDDPNSPIKILDDMSSETQELDTTVDAWRAALEVKDDEGQTIDEIVEATGVAPSTVRRKIKKLIKEGKCIKGKAARMLGNTKIRYHVYQLTGEEK